MHHNKISKTSMNHSFTNKAKPSEMMGLDLINYFALLFEITYV